MFPFLGFWFYVFFFLFASSTQHICCTHITHTLMTIWSSTSILYNIWCEKDKCQRNFIPSCTPHNYIYTIHMRQKALLLRHRISLEESDEYLHNFTLLLPFSARYKTFIFILTLLFHFFSFFFGIKSFENFLGIYIFISLQL